MLGKPFNQAFLTKGRKPSFQNKSQAWLDKKIKP